MKTDLSMFIPTFPILTGFIPVASEKQQNRAASLLTLGYILTKFIINDITGKAIAVFSNPKNVIVLYPDGFHDIRVDKSFDIVREF
jgi:hypothetical protein